MDIKKMYDESVTFHGHRCPGLAIGVRAAAEALRLLDAERSADEELVCVTENNACGVDGIQTVLGCTAGKGNLIFRLTGKHAYTFYNRKNGKSIRLSLKNLPKMESREEKQDYILTAPFEEIFAVTAQRSGLPPEASLYPSVDCEICGESTAEPYIRMKEGKKICVDCYKGALQKEKAAKAASAGKKVVVVVQNNGDKSNKRTH